MWYLNHLRYRAEANFTDETRVIVVSKYSNNVLIDYHYAQEAFITNTHKFDYYDLRSTIRSVGMIGKLRIADVVASERP